MGGTSQSFHLLSFGGCLPCPGWRASTWMLERNRMSMPLTAIKDRGSLLVSFAVQPALLLLDKPGAAD